MSQREDLGTVLGMEPQHYCMYQVHKLKETCFFFVPLDIEASDASDVEDL